MIDPLHWTLQVFQLDPASFPTNDQGIVFQMVMNTVANSGVECAMDPGSTLAKGQQFPWG